MCRNKRQQSAVLHTRPNAFLISHPRHRGSYDLTTKKTAGTTGRLPRGGQKCAPRHRHRFRGGVPGRAQFSRYDQKGATAPYNLVGVLANTSLAWRLLHLDTWKCSDSQVLENLLESCYVPKAKAGSAQAPATPRGSGATTW